METDVDLLRGRFEIGLTKGVFWDCFRVLPTLDDGVEELSSDLRVSMEPWRDAGTFIRLRILP